MKNSFKIGLLAMVIALSAAGCSGCQYREKGATGEKIDTSKTNIDSPKTGIDTSTNKVDTAKKDTTKKS